MNVIYNSSNGRVVAVGDGNPRGQQEAVDLPESAITAPIQGTRVDDTAAPSETVRDSALPQADDLHTRQSVGELATVRARYDAVQAEISEGNIPDRATSADVDAVLTELEADLSDLRGSI